MNHLSEEEIVTSLQHHLHTGRFEKADQLIVQLLETGVDSAKLFNMRGVIKLRQQQYQDAIEAFIQALKQQPDFIEAMYNLALAYRANQQVDDAINSLLAILSADPMHQSSYLLLGKIFLEEKRLADAEKLFKCALEKMPDSDTFLKEMINTLLLFDAYREALFFCEQLRRHEPDAVSNLYDLGVIEAKLHHVERAKNYYHAALQIEPAYFPALNNLAVLYLDQQNFDAAKFYFEQALRQQPDNESIKYSLHAISGGKVFDDAPQSYIQSLFDQYADHYETHLTQGLEYVAPKHLEKYVLDNLIQTAQLSILDLGCGTGLCGPIFKPHAAKLTGIDLSPKMIEQARAKNCYDDLVVAEDRDYLLKYPNTFDLILAADVLIYQGDLWKILQAAFNALKPDGVFAFTLEANDTDHYRLEKTGRFSHGATYVERLAKKIGYKILVAELNETRTQREDRLLGHYFLLQRP